MYFLSLKRTRTNDGNILVLILIAVALFAALSYVISSSTRGTAQNASNEEVSMQAGRVSSFITGFRTAYIRLTSYKGASISSVKFANDVYQRKNGVLANGAMGAPASPTLYMFHPHGGGVVPLLFTDISTPCSSCGGNKPAIGHLATLWLNMPDIGSAETDFAIQIWGVSEGVCKALNKSVGVNFIPTVSESPVYHTDGMTPPALPVLAGLTAADEEAINGKLEICYKRDAPAPTFNYTAVIQAY